jgi:hypothetical protein
VLGDLGTSWPSASRSASRSLLMICSRGMPACFSSTREGLPSPSEDGGLEELEESLSSRRSSSATRTWSAALAATRLAFAARNSTMTAAWTVTVASRSRSCAASTGPPQQSGNNGPPARWPRQRATPPAFAQASRGQSGRAAACTPTPSVPARRRRRRRRAATATSFLAGSRSGTRWRRCTVPESETAAAAQRPRPGPRPPTQDHAPEGVGTSTSSQTAQRPPQGTRGPPS